MVLIGSRQEMIAKATELIKNHIRSLLEEQDHVVLAVPGGRNVAEIFLRLRDSDVPWSHVDIFMLDERLVPTDHQESNFRQAHEILGAVVEKGRLHPFIFEADNPEAGLISYNDSLKDCGGKVDIVLASSGEDGHIASLFPNHPSLWDRGELFILVHNSPKLPADRISASADCIARAKIGLILFFGKEKRQALRNYQDPDKSLYECPAKMIGALPTHYVLTDQEVEKI